MDYLAIARTLRDFAVEGTSFMFLAAVMFGIGIVLWAIVLLIRKGMPRGDDEISFGSIGMKFFIGALLTVMGWTMGLVLDTTGDTQALSGALSYVRDNSANNEVVNAIWVALGAWCVFLGTIAFFRGLLLLNKSTAGGRDAGDDVWRAFWHIVGGALTVQIFRVWL
jgi:multisubunit Na+/H+ antiporter MnhB subunit